MNSLGRTGPEAARQDLGTEMRRNMPCRLSNSLRAIVVLLSAPWASLSAAQAQAPITAQTPAQQAAEDRILAILEKPYSAKFKKRPLAEVVAEIGRSTGLPIYLDRKTLDDASIPLDAPVSCDLPLVSLHAVLGLILKPLDLVWTIDNECVLVTNSDAESLLLVTKAYPVLDLIAAARPANPRAGNYQAIIQLITDLVWSGTWDEVGGQGAISQFAPSGSLVITQSFAVHQRIALLLAALRKARGRQQAQDAPRQVGLTALQAMAPIAAQTAAEQAAEDRIRLILEKPYAAKFEKTAFADVMATITRSTGLFIQIDTKALEEAAIALDKPVSCQLPEAPLRSALGTILKPLGLVWAIDNQCLLVTTPDKAKYLLVIKVYPVQDLIPAADPMALRAIHYQRLMKEITEAIAPTTWNEKGGPAVVSPFSPTQTLVIFQTCEIHDEIALQLTKMRKARDP
jgi:hypothetical protein